MNLDWQDWVRLTKGGRTLSIRLDRIDVVETLVSGLVILHVNGQTINLTVPESKEFMDFMSTALLVSKAAAVKSTARVVKP